MFFLLSCELRLICKTLYNNTNSCCHRTDRSVATALTSWFIILPSSPGGNLLATRGQISQLWQWTSDFLFLLINEMCSSRYSSKCCRKHQAPLLGGTSLQFSNQTRNTSTVYWRLFILMDSIQSVELLLRVKPCDSRRNLPSTFAEEGVVHVTIVI